MAIVEMHSASGRGLDVTLVEDEYVVGTRSSCDLVIEGDDTVSRVHARLKRNRSAWSVVDLGSKNGTLANSKPVIGERRLHHGDEIVIGRWTKLVFRDAQSEYDKTTDVIDPPPKLTPREHDVLVELLRPLYDGGFFAQPASVAAIAEALFVGDGAVKNHLGTLFDKFGIVPVKGGESRRVQLARAAWQRGAIGPDDFKKQPA